MSGSIPRIAIIDDTPLIRRGLRSLVQTHPVLGWAFEAGSVSEAAGLLAAGRPQLIISELDFGSGEGAFDLLHLLQSRGSRIPVLVFSHLNERIWATRALQAGAQGYLMKSATDAELIAAIERVLSGKIFLSRCMTDHAIDHLAAPAANGQRPPAIEDLTNRELEVLKLIGEGLASKEIADALHISLKTVESHRAHLRTKLGVDNSAGLICLASQWQAFDRSHG